MLFCSHFSVNKGLIQHVVQSCYNYNITFRKLEIHTVTMRPISACYTSGRGSRHFLGIGRCIIHARNKVHIIWMHVDRPSPCSPWWPIPYLVGVGFVLLLHSFRSRATSWVTPTPAMSSFICWCHVFLGRPRRLVPGIAISITLRVTLVASRL